MAEEERAGAREAEAPQEEGKKEKKGSGLGGLLILIGGFFLSFAVIMVAMFFMLRGRLAEVEAAREEAVELTQEPDSVVVVPTREDSLQVRIQELVDEVKTRDVELVQLSDSTSRLTDELSSTRRQLDTLQQRELELSNEEVQKLSRVFESMQPRKAAPVLMKMDNGSVAAILLKIDERSAAKILASMPPERAAGISSLIRQRAKEKARREREQRP